jgi:RNA polymerase sigma factor (sigma-70 family)
MAAPQGDSPAGFEDFYRRHYRSLMKLIMAAGATLDEAYEAVDQTMEELLRRWHKINFPWAYARKAVVSNFLKRRKRDRECLTHMIKGGHVCPESDDCREMNVWEDEEWIAQLLAKLPPTQREVIRCLVDGRTQAEIAELLGKTPEAIRKNLQLARERLRPLVQDKPGRPFRKGPIQ